MKNLKIVAIVFFVLGAVLLLIAIQFKFMNWPDMWKGFISGPVCMLIGLIVWVVYRIQTRNVKK